MTTEQREGLSLSDTQNLVRIFRALTDESRLRIVHVLMNVDRISVSEIASELEQHISNVSHHLRILRDLGFVKREREGKWIYHSLDDECIEDIMRRALEHVGGK
ncbi:MAG: winged helix-turn-helix transcriptional regulator [Candidatus Thorarchaeota archaeon]|nr:MAG: winged helix-turn-helix transcriptional regulator [Candidatus Thorarchaeota archaeon]